ncbi:ribonuclease H-like domain-containing protein [Neohortaea acidophila]|uniref:Ribonuclease H-like domain-containing protein n=1 Tax=Neohortaea acidophila TaxID=245834 RepID=A0A6A6PNM6_9PEZI|nr:ribonuclease H-like domain-containing protein [Neohortaea acidophila]KAF2481612.1 ribonuclease H-like domain-containing protein [Neohortaea acidophila]
MEIDKVSFYPLILDLLTDISHSHFVAFDLELSGVPTKYHTSYAKGKPSLQDRYSETKEAAERYQILQIGLTCVEQDVELQKYILKPYNIELSPTIEERGIDVERIFSFQSGAVDFLLKVGFDFSAPFKWGVPYLSREESKQAREKFQQRQDRTAISDINIKPTEVEALAFMEHVRSEVNAWLKGHYRESSEYLDITKASQHPSDSDGEEQVVEGLSRFEKRLVHQLVRSEYPDLVTISKRDFIQIVRFDQQREDRIHAERVRDLEAHINKQKGFRWIIEALHGSKLTGLPLRECARDPANGEAVFCDMDDFQSRFNRAQRIIKGNPRMLVGHNCFLDLVYIYKTFIGPLPNSVEEFQQKIHHIWPNIVDTKYMSTHNCGDINPVSSLEQIATQLSAERKPTLEIDAEHMKYSEAEALHEAGYDSFLTAQIATRLSAKLAREGNYVDHKATREEQHITAGINGVHIADTDAPQSDSDAVAGASSTPSEVSTFTPSEVGGKWKRKGDPSLPPQDPHDPFIAAAVNAKLPYHDAAVEQSFEGGMPGRRSEFWSVYGNKLRVFGTEEGMCVLDGSGGRAEGLEVSGGGVMVV